MASEKLTYYLQKWDLSNPTPLAETNTSTVYTVEYKGEKVVLKMLNESGIHDEASGAVALRCWNSQGAVKLFEHDEAAHLLEYAGDNDLVPMVEHGQDEEAAHIIGDVLNKLHSAYTGAEPTGLWKMRRRFKALFDKAETDKIAGEQSIFIRGAKVAEKLLTNPQHETVLHGDIHHWNIRQHPTRGWLAFDPKGVYGEKTYDAANTLYNPFGHVITEDRVLRISKILSKKIGISQERILAYAFAYGCLSASWSMEDGDNGYEAVRIAGLIEPHVQV